MADDSPLRPFNGAFLLLASLLAWANDWAYWQGAAFAVVGILLVAEHLYPAVSERTSRLRERPSFWLGIAVVWFALGIAGHVADNPVFAIVLIVWGILAALQAGLISLDLDVHILTIP